MPARKAPKVPDPLESEVQRNGMALLRARGWVVLRRNVLAMKKGKHYVKGGETGQSDTYGTTPSGVHFELEFKRRRERPTDEQLRWLLAMNGRGRNRAVAFWVDNLDDLEQVARRVEQGWRVVYDLGPEDRPGDYHLELTEDDG